MRKLFVAVLTILAVGIAAFLSIPFFLSTDMVRTKITDLVRENTGRELIIDGKAEFSVFPSLAIRLKGAGLSNPAGMSAGPMVHMKELDIGLKLLPLMRKQLEIDHLVLSQPVFDLYVDRRGRNNWSFTQQRHVGEQLASVSGSRGHEKKANMGKMPELRDIRLNDIRIDNGTFLLRNDATGSKQSIEEINLAISMPQLDAQMEATGNFIWRGEKVEFSTAVNSVEMLLAGDGAEFKLEAGSNNLEAKAAGRAFVLPDIQVSANIGAKTRSVRYLARLAGAQMPEGGGLGPFAITSSIQASPTKISFENASIQLDNMQAEGGAVVSTVSGKPFLQATLAADQLDLNTYLNKKNTSTFKAREGDSIGKLINKIDAGSPPAKQPASENIDFSALQMLNADLRLSVGSIFYKKIKIDSSALSVSLKDGHMRANLQELQMYGGRAAGNITLDGRGRTPKISTALNVHDVQANPLLKDAIDLGWMSGKAQMMLNIATAGHTSDIMKRNLNGSSSLLFNDGAVEGVNIAGMIRNLKEGNFVGWSGGKGEAARTDFSTLSASFNIKDGIAHNKDLKFIGPLVRITGNGSADIPRKHLDYHVSPRLVASIKGQGGDANMGGIDIPVWIKGPWEKPSFVPDLQHLLRDPKGLIDRVQDIDATINNIKKRKKSGGVGAILEGFLGEGKGDSTNTTPEPAKQKIDPGKLLEGLFR
jgi:AsmA protein